MPQLGELLIHSDKHMRFAASVLDGRFDLAQSARAVGVFVPGRVEFLGKHTDYAGGRSLLMTVQRGFRLAAVARADGVVRIAAGAEGDDVRQFTFCRTPAPAEGSWARYAATAIERVALNFGKETSLRGADMAFVSDLPVASGLSSSSALMVAVFLALSSVNRLERLAPYRTHIAAPLQLAEYLGCVENGQSYGELTGRAGVGTFGGSEDHTAMLCCKEGCLSQFSFAPSVFEREVPFPAGMAMVVAASGVQAVKTAGAMDQYNLVSLRASRATEAFNRAAGTSCRTLREVTDHIGPTGLSEALRAIRQGVAPGERELDLPGRFEQFFIEDQQIIPAAGDALLRGDLDALGPLVDASQEGATVGLRNQIAQTLFLWRSARKLGAVAASAFGAGFGGSVWAMIEKDRTADFTEKWHKAYADAFAREAAAAEFFPTTPGGPAYVWTE